MKCTRPSSHSRECKQNTDKRATHRVVQVYIRANHLVGPAARSESRSAQRRPDGLEGSIRTQLLSVAAVTYITTAPVLRVRMRQNQGVDTARVQQRPPLVTRLSVGYGKRNCRSRSGRGQGRGRGRNARSGGRHSSSSSILGRPLKLVPSVLTWFERPW